MNLEKLNQWLTLAANLGVMTGIVFLVFELNQNTQALQTESYTSVLEMISEGEIILATNAEFHDLFVTGEKSPEQLPEQDWSRFTYFNFPRMGLWEYLFLGKEDGTITPAAWSAFDPYFRSIACLRGHRRFFDEQRIGHAPKFMTYLDEEVFPGCP